MVDASENSSSTGNAMPVDTKNTGMKNPNPMPSSLCRKCPKLRVALVVGQHREQRTGHERPRGSRRAPRSPVTTSRREQRGGRRRGSGSASELSWSRYERRRAAARTVRRAHGEHRDAPAPLSTSTTSFITVTATGRLDPEPEKNSESSTIEPNSATDARDDHEVAEPGVELRPRP